VAVPFMVALNALTQVFTFWALRHQQYRAIAASRIVMSLGMIAIKLLAGFYGLRNSGLILGTIGGQLVGFLVLLYLPLSGRTPRCSLISWRRSMELAKKFSDCPKFRLPQVFLDGIRDNGLVFLFSFFLGPTLLGHFALSARIVRIPLTMIGSAVSQVFFYRASLAHRDQKPLAGIVSRVLHGLTGTALLPLIVLCLFGPSLFAVVFGEPWRETGYFVRFMAPWMLLQLIASPVSQVPMILGQQKGFFIFNVIYNCSIVAALGLAAIYTGDARVSLILMSSVGSGFLVGMIGWIRHLVRQRDDGIHA
jgi:O-antigen/teichoic acid export membrane protein